VSDAELIALFVAWREEIDSEPYAHESTLTAVTESLLDGAS
jgi:hypothetical protein